MTSQILLAGFGGQGILFAGKLLAYAGMLENREVSWLPSYGPEMRGGTCNCSVIISDDPVGSPLVLTPDVLCVMNLPSLDKFEKSAAEGSHVFIDSTLIGRAPDRSDVKSHFIPATRLAMEHSLDGLANVIMCGKILRDSGVLSMDIMDRAMKKCVPARKADLIEKNMKALSVGYDYEG